MFLVSSLNMSIYFVSWSSSSLFNCCGGDNNLWRLEIIPSLIVFIVQLQSFRLSILYLLFCSFSAVVAVALASDVCRLLLLVRVYGTQCWGRNDPCFVLCNLVMVATVPNSRPISRTKLRMYVPPPHSTRIENVSIGFSFFVSLGLGSN